TLTVGTATFSGTTFETGAGGRTIVQNGATFNPGSNSFSLSLNGHSLELQGTSIVTGTVGNTGGTVNIAASTTLQVDANATFNDEDGNVSSGTPTGLTFNGAGSIVNLGTWEKSVNAVTSTVHPGFPSHGPAALHAKVDVETGTLALNGNPVGTQVDSFVDYIGAGTIQFGGGTRTLDSNSSISTANVVVSGGSLTD